MGYLTTKSNLKLNKLYFSIIDELSFRVKNLYNSALYEINNHYDSNKQYLNYNAMDKEPCCKQQTYKGNRDKRGLFITSKGVKINADVNGSLNIFKKAIKNLEQVVQDELISIPLNTGLVMNPLRVTLRTDLSEINQRSILLKIKINTPIVFNV